MQLATFDPGVLFLGFLRVSGFMFTTPVFGSPMVPTTIRVWLALLVAVVLMPAVGAAGQLPAIASGAFVIVAAREVLLGLLIGFVSSFFVYGVEFAGHTVGLQMGFGTSTLFDPVTQTEVSVLGTFKGMMAVTLFLVINGHNEVLSTFAASYRAIPPGGSGLAAAGIGGMVAASASIFDVAIRVSIPMLFALLMAEVGIAILAKTVFGLSVPYVAAVMTKAIHATNFDLRGILSALGGGR